MSKHENYEILNLIGYGLAKFDKQFEKLFGFKSKAAFYRYIVGCGIADTESTVKNRQDIFDPFFPNPRPGWWQKGDAYIHRKHTIDALYGGLSEQQFSDVVKLNLNVNFNASFSDVDPERPIQRSRYKQLQQTGLAAEVYFQHNYGKIDIFSGATLEDARLLGDGYDFQITFSEKYFLAEIKGVREKKGSIRMTEREYLTALEYKDLYSLVIVSQLNDIPQMTAIPNPVNELKFAARDVLNTQTVYTAKAW